MRRSSGRVAPRPAALQLARQQRPAPAIRKRKSTADAGSGSTGLTSYMAGVAVDQPQQTFDLSKASKAAEQAAAAAAAAKVNAFAEDDQRLSGKGFQAAAGDFNARMNAEI